MRILQNKEMSYKDKVLLDEVTNLPLKTDFLIKTVLENSNYSDSSQIIKAARIVSNLKVEEGEIKLEDSDFNFVKEMSAKYIPLVSKGLMFLDYFTQLE